MWLLLQAEPSSAPSPVVPALPAPPNHAPAPATPQAARRDETIVDVQVNTGSDTMAKR